MGVGRKRTSAILFLILFMGLLAVSSASVLIRLAQQGAPSIVVAAGRLGFASIIIAPFALWKSGKQILRFSFKQWILIILSGALLAIHFASWITSLEYTSIASSVVLVTTTPLWVALLSPFLLKEKIVRGVLFGLAFALVGGIIVGAAEVCSLENGGFTCEDIRRVFSGKGLLGNFLALIGAWTAAGYLLIGRKVRPGISLLTYIFPVYLTAAIILIFWSVINGYSFQGISPESFLWILLLAIFPQIIGHSSYNWALGYLPASYVSIALLGEPVGAVILSLLILQETPTLLELVGGTLILLGIIQATRAQEAQRISDN